MDSQVFRHPSYGKITVGRTTFGGGKGASLFGSELKHSELVHIQIDTAYLDRHLNHDWIHTDSTVVDFYMSPAQWAKFVSSFNDGSGTPITFRWIKGEGQIEEPPFRSTKKTFHQEFNDKLQKLVEKTRKLQNVVSDLLTKQRLAKEDKEQLKKVSDSIHTDIASNLTYIARCFDEMTEKSVEAAKAEVDAFTTHYIYSLGLEELNRRIEAGEMNMPLLELKNDRDIDPE